MKTSSRQNFMRDDMGGSEVPKSGDHDAGVALHFN